MAKIICITTGLTGMMNASFELVARLKSMGHQVIYAAPKDVGERVKTQGIRFVLLPEIPLHPAPDLPEYKGSFKKIKRWQYKIKHREERLKKAIENTDPKAFTALLEKESPDLLIIDIELHEYIFRAHARNDKFVLLSQWFSLWKRPGLPYLLHDTIPGKGWKGAWLALNWSWKIIKWKRWWTFTRQKIYTVHTDRRSVLKALAQQENFPMEYIKDNYWPGPFSYDHLPVLSMTAAEMDFPHKLRAHHFYIGPMVYEARVEPQTAISTAYSLEDVMDYRKKVGASLIYCSVSTLHPGDLDFVKKVIKAVKRRRDWVLLIGMGGLIVENALGTLPGNVFAFSYIPQLKVLKEADCSVNHGGIHTINECIYYKVPMLVYSGKRSDQNGCAARVDFHELGIMADKDKDQTSDIRSKIEQVINNKKFRKKIAIMEGHFQKYKNEKRAEEIIHRLLKTKTNESNI